MTKIYLDHSATTPVDEKVLATMMPFLGGKFGNPSSLHSVGQEAAEAVESSRTKVGRLLNCNPDEIIFTSGATESDNIAIFGLIRAMQAKGVKKMHLITSAIEHPAVLECFQDLEKESGISVTYLPVDKRGIVNVEELRKAILDQTTLVSIMHVNSEVGSVQPIEQIGKVISKNQKGRKSASKDNVLPLYFHSDATQAINYFDCNVEKNNLDMLSLSAHKVYGPKGIGVLYVKKGTPLESLQLGGHQESNLRSGTLNVPGIVGLGAALELVEQKSDVNKERIAFLRDMLVEGLRKKIPKIILNTDRENSTPSHAHFSFLGVEGEAVLLDLDFEGIEVSTGSACASGNHKASHVLLAMGIPQEVAHNSIRFTLGKNSKKEEIQAVIEVLPQIIKRLRTIAPKLT